MKESDWFLRVGPWALYRAMRSAGIRVSIDGHGADELIGGYHKFVERAMDDAIGRFDLRRYSDLRSVLAGLIGGTETSRYGSLPGELRLIAKGLLKRLRLLEATRAMLPRNARLGVGDSSLSQLLPQYDGPHRLYYDATDPRVSSMSPLQAMLFTWFHGSFLPTLLCNFDRASMSHGIEVRMPFMDWRLVTYAFSLPDASKIGGGYTKRVLRQAMRGFLPEPIKFAPGKSALSRLWNLGPAAR